jgi:hypothetical protein
MLALLLGDVELLEEIQQALRNRFVLHSAIEGAELDTDIGV